MKSIFLKKYGPAEKAFEIRETTKPKCGNEDVLIQVECFGLNYAEVMARLGLYQAAPPLPCVLGYEVAGVIVEVGSHVDTTFIGKRVVAFTRFGGYAEYAVTHKNAITDIDDMDAAQACCIAVQYATAWYMASVITNILPNDRVMIHAAAGGVGTALVQICKMRGAIVYANAGSDHKLAYLCKQGADVVLNYVKNDYAQFLKEQQVKFDVIFNPIAGSTFKKDYALLNAGGRLILFGGSERSGKKWGLLSSLNFLRKMGRIIPIFLVGHSKSVLGVNMLKIGDDKPELLARCMREVIEEVNAGRLNPQVGGTYSVSEIAAAHAMLEGRQSIGKIVMKW